MRVIDLALKDLSQIIRDKKSALFLVIMPIVFTGFMGLALGRGTQTDSRLPLGFVTADASGILSQNLQSMLNESKTLRVVSATDETQAAEQVQQGTLAAALIVPANFSAGTLAGDTVNLKLIADVNTPGGATARQAVQAIVARVLSMAQVGKLSVEQINAVQPFSSDAARQTTMLNAIAEASHAWRDPQLTVTMEDAYAAKTSSAPSSFAQSSPGMMVMFAVFGLTTTAMLLVTERKTRTLQRMITTGMSRAEIIAGHVLAMFVVVFAQELLLVLVGQMVFGVNYAREPLAIALVMAALALWTASLGLFIGVLAKVEDQAALWSLIAMFVFSALGGAWFPLEVTGQTFAMIGHLMPSAWAMDGFQNIVVRGLAFGSVLAPAGILLAYAAGFFGLAVWRFRFE